MDKCPECFFVKLFRLLFGKKEKKITGEERSASRQLIKNIMFKNYDFEWVDVRLGVTAVQNDPAKPAKFKNGFLDLDSGSSGCRKPPANRVPRRAATIKHLKDFDEEVNALKRMWVRTVRNVDNDTRHRIKSIFAVVRQSFIMELDLMFEVMAPGNPLLKDDFIRTKILEYTWDLHWEVEDAVEDGRLKKRGLFQDMISLSLKSKKLKLE